MMSTYLHANNKREVYHAYISNNMDGWKKVIDDMNLKYTKSHEFRLELVNYQYGYIAWCIGNNKDELAQYYLELAENNLKILENGSINPSMINAYKAAFYGYRIGLNIFQAPFIGPKSVECAELAIKLDSNNPFGYIQYGNSQYYMPSVFGGSKSLAIEYYKKAEKIMEQNREQLINDWNYLSQLTLIAKAYTDIEKYAMAKVYLEKVLKIEPNYLWVKNELYPELLQKMK